ncbi:MAG TPA: fibronectin type III domain-containing protein [Steroidobacteraceae bacterium]|nr:fibronectin type III domain-containing protein [Steroidobacteraceae bacterium]
MTNAKRGRGSHREVYLCVMAGLWLTLSACGGGAADSASTSAATASTPPNASSPVSTSTSGAGADGGSSSSSTSGSNPPPAGGKAVTINWMPPTENMDGTTLTDLAGYDILYGPASGYYTHKISVPNPGIATYVVDDLQPGTYYFSVAAVNSEGTESPVSAEVTATIN